MKFYIYYRPMVSIKFKEYLGDLIHVSTNLKDFSPDGEEWGIYCCNRSVQVYDRLLRMLAAGGIPEDDIYPLDGKRDFRCLLKHMTTWEKTL